MPPQLHQRHLPDPSRLKNAYVREDRILAHLLVLALTLVTATGAARIGSRGCCRARLDGGVNGQVAVALAQMS